MNLLTFISATLLIITSEKLANVAAAGPQLRGRSNTGQLQRRILNDDSGWCPTYFPGTNTDCPLTGMFRGTCYYSSSAKEGETPNTDSQACSCNAEMAGKFWCEPSPFPGGAPTPPPSPRALPEGSWCPELFPGSDTECPLTGMVRGTCFYTSSAPAGEPPNNDHQACVCNGDGTSRFVCEPRPFPGSGLRPPATAKDPAEPTTGNPTQWCPPDVPNTGDSCALPAGKTTGSCTFIRRNTITLCSCSSDTQTFVCN